MSREYILGPGEHTGTVDSFVGQPVRILARGDETRGDYALLEMELERGFSAPLHVHHDADESFYLISGEMEAACGDDRYVVGEGGFAFLPRGKPHSFLIRSPRARILVVNNPSGFEKFVEAVAGTELGEDSLPVLEAASEKHGMTILGPTPLRLP